ncbi:MAG: hypothetical protein KC731_24165 [Myxococcales bacterium]|nr:hypothetical protein [Myxococcales bacterium]
MEPSFFTATIREGQHRSPFTAILETFCESCRGAVGAALVDEEGEAVDIAAVPVPTPCGEDVTLMPGYDLKLCGAYWQIVLREARTAAHLGDPSQLWVFCEGLGFIVNALAEGYVLMLVCRPDALSAVSRRAIRQVEVELAVEAGWPIPEPERPYWRRCRVRLDARGQPDRFQYAHGLPGSADDRAQPWQPLRVEGPLTGLEGFEKGFRVALRAPLESAPRPLDLVREPTGTWYAAER